MLTLQFLLALTAALVLGACGGGGGEAEEDGPGSPADPGNQPPIVLLDVAGSLGTALGDPDPAQRDTDADRVIQAVSGIRHVCALVRDGRVWCWGDPVFVVPGREPPENAIWPVQPTLVRRAPPLRRLVVADVFTPPGSLTVEAFRGTCGEDDEGNWWCWGGHPNLPGFQRLDMMTAAIAPTGYGELRRAGLPAPSNVASRLDPAAGIADMTSEDVASVLRANLRCALTRDAELYCWSQEEAGLEAFRTATFARGTKISGSCALAPEGDLRCHLPMAEGRACPLGLQSMIAFGTRGCGERADGEWRCFGRPAGTGVVTLPGLIDLPFSECGDVP